MTLIYTESLYFEKYLTSDLMLLMTPLYSECRWKRLFHEPTAHFLRNYCCPPRSVFSICPDLLVTSLSYERNIPSYWLFSPLGLNFPQIQMSLSLLQVFALWLYIVSLSRFLNTCKLFPSSIHSANSYHCHL